MIEVVTYTDEPLPPIYGIRWNGLYLAGFLTADARARYVEQKGWRVERG